MRRNKLGWGGRIRTFGTRYQKALPYRLATPQIKIVTNEKTIVIQAYFFELLILLFLVQFICVRPNGMNCDLEPG